VTSLLNYVRRSFAWPYPTQGFESFNYGGQQYFGVASSGYATPDKEAPPSGFAQLVDGPFRSNAIVFACELKRISVFSEARFLWRGFSQGRPGKLFSTVDLDILENPWPRGTTSDLLAEIAVMADIGGNGYTVRTAEEPDRLRVLRPDWVTLVMGDPQGRPVQSSAQLNAEILGLIYDPRDGQTEPETILAEEFAHYIPPGMRDPLARFRGMSWLTPILREVQGDQAATMHKLAFFENGATPQMVVTFDATVTQDQFQGFVSKMDETHKGWRNAYKTLYIGGGATPTVVGKDLHQLDFSATQGKGETRIAAASGIHPVLVPVSEGMQGSSLNAGNYSSARRSTADTTFRPMWRNLCGSLKAIVPPPNGAELWYDEANIPFLREDSKDQAEILSRRMLTIESGVRAGYKPESVVAAVDADDLTLLKHTGLFSVQLQPPGTVMPARAAGNGSNGSESEPVATN
jgi:hypothetical protein